MKYRPELDGLRGIAVLLVLFEHAGVPVFGTGGTVGVTLFFVLSGYLITSLLVAEIQETGRIDFIAFYTRRALRLLPALYALLVVLAILLVLGLLPERAVAHANYGMIFLSVIFYAANWFYMAGYGLMVLGHTWSLAVEEQFYIFWPVLLLATLRLGRQRLALLLVLVAMAITPWREILMIRGDTAHVLAGFDTHADALMLGCAVALLEPKYPAVVGWLGIAGILLLSTAWEFGPSPIFAQLSLVTMATVASTAAVAACPKALTWRPLAAVGKISYGLYLWHGIIVWYQAPWPVTVAVSFAAAIASWFLVERPFLALKRRFSRVTSHAGRPAGAVTGAADPGEDATEGTAAPLPRPTAALGG